MKILVCISHVHRYHFKKLTSQITTQNLIQMKWQFVINPYDEFVLTRAMWFKEKQGASVTVVHVEMQQQSLHFALAIGADMLSALMQKP